MGGPLGRSSSSPSGGGGIAEGYDGGGHADQNSPLAATSSQPHRINPLGQTPLPFTRRASLRYSPLRGEKRRSLLELCLLPALIEFFEGRPLWIASGLYNPEPPVETGRRATQRHFGIDRKVAGKVYCRK